MLTLDLLSPEGGGADPTAAWHALLHALQTLDDYPGYPCEVHLVGDGELRVAGEGLIVDSSRTFSQLRLVGRGHVVLRASATLGRSMLTAEQGAPPLSIDGLRFEGSSQAPAISILQGAHVAITSSIFAANQQTAIFCHSGELELTASTFTANSHPTLPGGALRLLAAHATITTSEFRANRAAYGGAIAFEGDPSLALTRRHALRIRSSSFVDNHGVDGGAIAVRGAVADIFSSTFDANNASRAGGALHAQADSHVTLRDRTQLSANKANTGRSLFLGSGSLVVALPTRLGSWMSNVFECKGVRATHARRASCPLAARRLTRMVPFIPRSVPHPLRLQH